MSAPVPSPKEALLEARPPTTDYITYLTIVEYNLSKDVLPTLNEVLQDEELTINVGWDLVQLLLPYLPEAEECLQTIAHLGNPREVVLKVTEALRLLEFVEDQDDGDSEDGQEQRSTDLVVSQFQVLMRMLTVLHPRIKTKYPSRFLATTLQAVLLAYQRAQVHAALLTDSVLSFVKTISGSKRPQLPPRTASSDLLGQTSAVIDGQVHPALRDTDQPSVEDSAMQTRLLQSFLTHILEDYMLSLTSADDVPGLAWCSRFMEKTSPERIPDVPGKVPFVRRFADEEPLTARTSTVGQTVAIARDLGLLNPAELLKLCLDAEPEATKLSTSEDEPPSSVEDIPLSKAGALFLYAANVARQRLFATSAGGTSDEIEIEIFPVHKALLTNYTGATGSVEPVQQNEALVDTILFLGLVSLQDNQVGQPEDEEFINYLQTTSLLSANCQSPTLRYHAHYITSTVLRSHPSDIVRLTFIRDTLEHCPYENLKASAVGWLKGETIEANLVPLMRAQGAAPPADDKEESIFATPVALTTLAPYLFPSITSSGPLADAWAEFQANLTFYLTALNLCYFLLKAQPLHLTLDVKGLLSDSDVGGSFLAPMKTTVDRLGKALGPGGKLHDEESEDTEVARAELDIFTELIENITVEITKLNQERS